MKYTLFLSLLFCAVTLPTFGQLSQTDLDQISKIISEQVDLDKIRLIINDEVKKENSESEKRMKEYINIKVESIEKRLNMLFGVVIALIAVIAVPQIIIAWRSSKYSELEKKVEQLTEEIQLLKQQRIIGS